MLAAAEAAREAGNAPNSVLAAAASILGPRRVAGARAAPPRRCSTCSCTGSATPATSSGGLDGVAGGTVRWSAPRRDPRAAALLAALEARGAQVGVRALPARARRSRHGRCRACGDRADAGLGAAAAQADQPAHGRSTCPGTWPSTAPDRCRGPRRPARAPTASAACPTTSSCAAGRATELAGLALTGRRPGEAELFSYQVLLGLLLSNGPGTISAQGAKGAVSADGPETPGAGAAQQGHGRHVDPHRLQPRRQRLRGHPVPARAVPGRDRTTRPHRPRLDVAAMATAFAQAYKQEKAQRRETGGDGARAIPGVNHPVFRGKPVNTDPREAFVGRLMQERGEHNVFHDYYRAVVQALFDQGVTSNVFCVNVDGVIAAWLLQAALAALPRGRARRRRRWRAPPSPSSCSPGWRARPPRSRTISTAAATWTPARRPRRCDFIV